jgi:hypothetical protein
MSPSSINVSTLFSISVKDIGAGLSSPTSGKFNRKQMGIKNKITIINDLIFFAFIKPPYSTADYCMYSMGQRVYFEPASSADDFT